MSWSESLVDQIADRVLDRVSRFVSSDDRIFGAKLTFDEGEAAEILGVPRYVLKGCRERGEITPTKIGKKYQYTRKMLIEFAEGQHV